MKSEIYRTFECSRNGSAEPFCPHPIVSLNNRDNSSSKCNASVMCRVIIFELPLSLAALPDSSRIYRYKNKIREAQHHMKQTRGKQCGNHSGRNCPRIGRFFLYSSHLQYKDLNFKQAKQNVKTIMQHQFKISSRQKEIEPRTDYYGAPHRRYYLSSP